MTTTDALLWSIFGAILAGTTGSLLMWAWIIVKLDPALRKVFGEQDEEKRP